MELVNHEMSHNVFSYHFVCQPQHCFTRVMGMGGGGGGGGGGSFFYLPHMAPLGWSRDQRSFKL